MLWICEDDTSTVQLRYDDKFSYSQLKASTNLGLGQGKQGTHNNKQEMKLGYGYGQCIYLLTYSRGISNCGGLLAIFPFGFITSMDLIF